MTLRGRGSQRRTSERVDIQHYGGTPNDRLVMCMHVATYDFARSHVVDRRVLDFGCGTGYGVQRLAPSVSTIIGVDVSSAAIDVAVARNEQERATFLQVDPVEQRPLPFPADHFDTVLSFQVIEHVPDPAAYVAEVRRLLRPGGTFVCATPDRRLRLDAGQRPWNIHHLYEYTPDELQSLIHTRFEEVEVYGMVTSPPELAEIELERYRKARRASKPFTWPGAPEWWRRAGLGMLRLARTALGGTPEGPTESNISPENIEIRSQTAPSLNIVTVAR